MELSPGDEEKLSAAWSRRGKDQRNCLKLMREHEHDGALPTSNRFIEYELEQQGLWSKKRSNLDGSPSIRRADTDISAALTHLREVGLVEWDWIVDETRQLDRWRYGTTIADALRQEIGRVRIDRWQGQPPPLILTESRSLGGVLRGLAAEHLCPIASFNGQVGGFLYTDIIPFLAVAPRPVLYLGDLDLQGGHIEQNARRVIEDVLERELDWTRVAITGPQTKGIEPIKKVDGRYKPPLAYDAWETEALGQLRVVALLRQALELRLPEPLEDVLAREAEQRADFLDQFDETEQQGT